MGLFRHRHRILSASLPTAQSYSPTTGAVGDTITLTGTAFGAVQGAGAVTISGRSATIVSWSATSIVFKVPAQTSYPSNFGGVVVITDAGASSLAPGFFVTTGGAAAFAGASTQFLGCVDNAALSMGAGVRMTIGAWIFPTSFATTTFPIAKGAGGGAATLEYLFQINTAGSLALRISDGITTRSTSGQILTLNAWNFVIGQYDGSNITTSLNGGALGASVVGADIQDSTQGLRFGTGSTGASPYTGSLDGVGLWKRALTAGEITTLYNAGVGLNYASAVALGGTLLNNLAAWWDLDDAGGSGATWVDRLGVSNLTAGTGAAAPTSVRGVR